jgi:hypothetical protein
VGEVEVHELWHEDVKARNGWGHEHEVSVKTRKAKWEGKWNIRSRCWCWKLNEWLICLDDVVACTALERAHDRAQRSVAVIMRELKTG